MAETMVERRRFTVDDYYQMADAGIIGDHERVELIDGEVVIMSPIGRRHSACVSAATQALVLAGGTRADCAATGACSSGPLQRTATGLDAAASARRLLRLVPPWP